MARIAAVFPNEGSHYVGMGKEFYARSLSVRKFYDDTEKLLKLKIAKTCFLGPKEEQDTLVNAHLATFLNDVAFCDLLIQYRRKPEILTGVGVGEVAALVTAECLPFLIAAQFIVKRAVLLESFAKKHGGSSISLSGVTLEQLQPLLSREEGEAAITHYMTPDTFVVWGPNETIASLKAELQGIRQIKINSQLPRGPLFNPRFEETEGPLNALLNECLGEEKLKHPKIPFLSCSNGEPVETPDAVREVLIKQYSRPVQWVQTVKAIIFRGFRTWVEVGPGRVYTTMVKKIDVNTRITNVEDAKTLSTTVKVTG